MKTAVPDQPAKPKMLVLELWGLGDLAIATPFLQAASKSFQVTLLAKPHALGLQPHFWPAVRVVPFTAPWTAFKGKYRLFSWPWRELNHLLAQLRDESFALAISARWDPRDHLLLKLSGIKRRLGFARAGSGLLLSESFRLPKTNQHRYQNWRTLGHTLGFNLPARPELPVAAEGPRTSILIHSGAAQPVRVWPLERFRSLAGRLQGLGYAVKIVCDPPQEQWWRDHGESDVLAPDNLPELLTLLNQSALFIGNDSGPGHLAAICGVPTFSIFGPQLPELFVPLHRDAEWIEGKPCPYKPCSDWCRLPAPHCLLDLSEAEVWEKVESFVHRVLPRKQGSG